VKITLKLSSVTTEGSYVVYRFQRYEDVVHQETQPIVVMKGTPIESLETIFNNVFREVSRMHLSEMGILTLVLTEDENESWPLSHRLRVGDVYTLVFDESGIKFTENT